MQKRMSAYKTTLVIIMLIIVGCKNESKHRDSISVVNYDDSPIHVSYCSNNPFEGKQLNFYAKNNWLCGGYYELEIDEMFTLKADNSKQKLYVRVIRNGKELDFEGEEWEKANFLISLSHDFTVEQHPERSEMKKLKWDILFDLWNKNEINWIPSNKIPQGWGYQEMIRDTDGSTNLYINPK